MRYVFSFLISLIITLPIYSQGFSTVNSNSGGGTIGTTYLSPYNEYISLSNNRLLQVRNNVVSRPYYGSVNVLSESVIYTDYNNSSSGSNYFGADWYIRESDKYIPFDDGNLLLFVNNGADEVRVKPFSPLASTWYDAWEDFHTIYDNNANGYIGPSSGGGWQISSDDVYIPGDFDGDGDDEILAARPGNNWAMLLENNGSSGFTVRWSNSGNDYIGPGGSSGWNMSSGDKYFSGEFIVDSNGKEQLLAVGGAWAMLLSYDTANDKWDVSWGNSGNDYIGTWNLTSSDNFYSGTFAGDSRATLIAIKLSSWAMKLVYTTNSGWLSQWSNGGNGYIGPGGSSGWDMSSGDLFFVSNWASGTGYEGDELLCVSTSTWVMSQKYTPPTALSVSISGPSSFADDQTKTYTATASGGSGSYTNYTWERRNNNEFTWTLVGSGSSLTQVTIGGTQDFTLRCTVEDSYENTAVKSKSIIVYNGTETKANYNSLRQPLADFPTEYSLEASYPNPFNPETNIVFNLAKDSFTKLTVYNSRGQVVRTLVAEQLSAGAYSVVWKGQSDTGDILPSGVYLYQLIAGDFSQTRKMTLLK